MEQFRSLFAAADVAILSRLGEDATLDGVAVRGELSTPIDQAGLSGGMTGIQQFAFRLPDSQARSAELGSELEVLGNSYAVVNIVPEGNGITSLFLRLQA